MGAVAARALADVFSGGVHDGSPWARKGHGPALRRLFGKYSNPEIWSVYRKVRQIDKDHSGHLTIEETMQAVNLEEHHVLFIWDVFSQQNSLLDVHMLLTMVCAFSSAQLSEKGSFLLSLFDTSRTGLVTGAEVGKMCTTVLGIFGRCTGNVVKAKEINSALLQELPGLLPELREAADRAGAKAAFEAERLISRTELEERLLPSVEVQYGELPVAGPPPQGAAEPPVAKMFHGDPSASAQQSLDREPSLMLDGGLSMMSNSSWKQPDQTVSTPAGGGLAGVRALAASRSMADLGAGKPTVLNGLVGQEFLPPGVAPAQASGSPKQRAAPERAWLVIHAADFEMLAKDLPSFKHLFSRSTAAALGVPASCVEINDVTVGARGGTMVALALHGGRGGDTRSSRDVLRGLEQQLRSPNSALRRSRMADYLASAELSLSSPSCSPKTARDQSGTLLPQAGAGTAFACDREAQATDTVRSLQAVLFKLQAEKAQLEAAEEAQRAALEVLQERDAELARLRLQVLTVARQELQTMSPKASAVAPSASEALPHAHDASASDEENEAGAETPPLPTISAEEAVAAAAPPAASELTAPADTAEAASPEASVSDAIAHEAGPVTEAEPKPAVREPSAGSTASERGFPAIAPTDTCIDMASRSAHRATTKEIATEARGFVQAVALDTVDGLMDEWREYDARAVSLEPLSARAVQADDELVDTS